MDAFFSEYDLLEDKLCNILCDQILGNLREKFKDGTDKIALSGRLSSNLQESEEIPIRNIVFTTDDQEIYNYFQKECRTISPTSTGAVKFKNRTLLYFPELYFEFWLSDNQLEIVKFKEIPLQKITQIPDSTL